MKSHVQRSSIQFTQEFLKKTTKKVFKEYLSFICYDNIDFPENVKINTFNGYQSKGREFGGLVIPNNSEELYVLNLEQMAVAAMHKEILYHEFTHIMDNVIINTHISFENKLHNLHFLSEVRAKYIEYLFRAGFKDVKDNKRLNSKSLVLSDLVFKPISFTSEIERYNNKIINDINSISDKNFFDVINQIYYYIGFAVFAEKHSDSTIDFTPIIEKLSPMLGDTIQELIESSKMIPLDFNQIEQNVVTTIGNIEKSIYQYYINNHLYNKNS